jgi:hypothetical protein
MARIQGRSLIQQFIAPVSVTSDEAAGSYIDYNGWNNALITVQGGLVATGDSDDTMAFQLYRIDDVAAASADSDDEVAITAGIATLGPPADTDTALGIEHIDIDFQQHTLDNGCFVLRATASEGCAAAVSATIELYNANGKVSDTAWGTITVPASS